MNVDSLQTIFSILSLNLLCSKKKVMAFFCFTIVIECLPECMNYIFWKDTIPIPTKDVQSSQNMNAKYLLLSHFPWLAQNVGHDFGFGGLDKKIHYQDGIISRIYGKLSHITRNMQKCKKRYISKLTCTSLRLIKIH